MNKKHGGKGTKLYGVWSGMKNRCSNPKNCSYEYYGKLGITFSKDWEDFTIFRDWAEASGYKEGLTLERNDVKGNYDSSNCCWIPSGKQQRNKTDSIIWEIDGKEFEALQDAADYFEVSYDTIRRWCKGYKSKKKGKDYKYPPKEGCSFREKYG